MSGVAHPNVRVSDVGEGVSVDVLVKWSVYIVLLSVYGLCFAVGTYQMYNTTHEGVFGRSIRLGVMFVWAVLKIPCCLFGSRVIGHSRARRIARNIGRLDHVG